MGHGEPSEDFVAREQQLTAWFSERMLDLAELRPGTRVLDIATGRGEPAMRAAERVGPTGWVLGIDSDAAAIALGRARAPANVELVVADASAGIRSAPRSYFDVALSRWGLMSLPDAVDVLRAMHDAVLPGGSLVIAVWSTADWALLPRAATGATGSIRALRYAERETIARDVASAGWSLTHDEEHEVTVLEATTGDEVVAWAASFGLVTAGDKPIANRLANLAEAQRVDGVIRLRGRSRLVVARR